MTGDSPTEIPRNVNGFLSLPRDFSFGALFVASSLEARPGPLAAGLAHRQARVRAVVKRPAPEGDSN